MPRRQLALGRHLGEAAACGLAVGGSAWCPTRGGCRGKSSPAVEAAVLHGRKGQLPASTKTTAAATGCREVGCGGAAGRRRLRTDRLPRQAPRRRFDLREDELAGPLGQPRRDLRGRAVRLELLQLPSQRDPLQPIGFLALQVLRGPAPSRRRPGPPADTRALALAPRQS